MEKTNYDDLTQKIESISDLVEVDYISRNFITILIKFNYVGSILDEIEEHISDYSKNQKTKDFCIDDIEYDFEKKGLFVTYKVNLEDKYVTHSVIGVAKEDEWDRDDRLYHEAKDREGESF